MAQPFDAERLSIAGDPVAVAERVGSFRDGGFFSASNNGVLIYRTTDTNSQVSWFDRQGAIISRVSEPGAFRDVALSADGARAVVSRTNPQDAATADLWLLDVSGRGGATRLTLGGEIAEFPVWSADNRRIIYTLGKNRLRQKLASGDADDEDVLQSRTVGVIKASHSSPDGRYLLYTAHDLKTTKWDLWVLPRDNPKPVPFVRTAFDEIDGRFSPDGRWVAYVSNQSGVNEVYVREFTTDFAGGSAGVGGSMLVSRGGGTAPRWRGDGRELFYLATSGQMMSVEVKPGPTFHALAPTVLFQSPAGTIVGDAAPDGKRFLLVTPVGPSASAPFTVVLNWTSALKN
jgi:Tol biopolymer transport system component